MLTANLTAGDRSRLLDALETCHAQTSADIDPDESDESLLRRARRCYAPLYDALGVTQPVSDWMLGVDPEASLAAEKARAWRREALQRVEAWCVVILALVVGLALGHFA